MANNGLCFKLQILVDIKSDHLPYCPVFRKLTEILQYLQQKVNVRYLTSLFS